MALLSDCDRDCPPKPKRHLVPGTLPKVFAPDLGGTELNHFHCLFPSHKVNVTLEVKTYKICI